MERQFTATVYLFHENRTLLHLHAKLGKWLPPGGHMEPNETPPEAARREVREETGLEIVFIEQENLKINAYNGVSIERPFLCLLENIPAHKDKPAHQHIDFIYLAKPLEYKDLGNNKLNHLASVKAPAIELSERGLVSKQYNPLSDNLNPGALTQPNGSIYCFPDPKEQIDGFRWFKYEELQELELFPDVSEVLRLVLNPTNGGWIFPVAGQAASVDLPCRNHGTTPHLF